MRGNCSGAICRLKACRHSPTISPLGFLQLPPEPAERSLMMGPQVRPFLMFTGKAEEAMNFFVSLFAALDDPDAFFPGELEG
jgi:hypothetical protein